MWSMHLWVASDRLFLSKNDFSDPLIIAVPDKNLKDVHTSFLALEQQQRAVEEDRTAAEASCPKSHCIIANIFSQ